MNKELNSLLETTLIPKIINLIVIKDGNDEITAINNFYTSTTYELLMNEDTDIWHFSPLTIYNMYKSEKEKGNIFFPVEG